ncbi:MAG: helix-turn-helix domain-containing protein [Candidatus Binataceae bacterium]
MTTLGEFIRQRRKELGLVGCEVAAALGKADGTPISIPYLLDLENDHRKPSDAVLNQLATVLQVDADLLFFLEGRRAPDLRLGKVDLETLRDALRTLRRNLDGRGGPL